MQGFPARITLTWTFDPRAQSHEIASRPFGPHQWQTIANLPGNAIEFVDASASLGKITEFRVTRSLKIGSQTIDAHGYIAVANTVAPVEFRGGVVLIVEREIGDALQTELARLESDLVGDGWAVTTIEVDRDDSPQDVRESIRESLYANPEISTVFLFGHVPVPYSGNICPDGHEEHRGAWPADIYYADIEGDWSDSTVNNASAELPANRNVPGDGKFDVSAISCHVALAVGRVDFANMPAFGPMTETGLLRRYLDRNHAYRHGQIEFDKRAIIDDHFGDFNGDAFAVTGWRGFAPIVGRENIGVEPWLSLDRKRQYLWAYACGGGSYTSAMGIACTADFTTHRSPALFTFLFGSYFGDWNTPDSLLRAPLAAGALTCAWAGYPAWYPHVLGAGLTTGDMAFATQNNGIHRDYVTPINGFGEVHVALMGDPTLRLNPIPPPENLTVTASANAVTLSWNPSPATVAGYAVYRATSPAGPFEQISPGFVTATKYTDFRPTATVQTYMVRAMRLEETPSGTYYNLSQGAVREVKKQV